MIKTVFLYYKNRNLQDENFHFHILIPFLWQEMYDLELIEKQSNKIIKGINQNIKDAVQLIVPIEKAIYNLEIKSKSFTSEKEDKKKLRIELLDFLKNNVAIKTDLRLDLYELIEFHETSEDLINELKSFHTDRKKELRYQREPLSFRAVGYNENFEKHSKVYQSLLAEENKHTPLNLERQKQAIKARGSSQNKSSYLESIFLILIIIGFLFIGLLLMILRGNYFLGFIFILISISIYSFNRNKFKINKS